MSKKVRVNIKMISTAINELTGKITGYFKTTSINPRNTEKLELMMYDPVARKKVLFKKAKIK